MAHNLVNKTHHTERKRKKVSDHRPDFLMQMLIEVQKHFLHFWSVANTFNFLIFCIIFCSVLSISNIYVLQGSKHMKNHILINFDAVQNYGKHQKSRENQKI